ncbi:PqiC family protein [Derxia lacustris]|uniref:PqiC family protein n=1 Tax=Derxia lacustris TaxID=764842 RepID=UPI000A16FE48|nr:ABC-type transport auxiliary lipoprotein family protein [Derxia lacustris]
MTRVNLKCLPTLLALGLLLAGCAAKAPALHLVTLPAAPTSTSAQAPDGLALTVRRVALPEYLQSRELRFRDGAAGIVSWPGGVWAERVEVGATRELAVALRRTLPSALICESGCAEAAALRRVLAVDVVKLDIDRAARRLDGEVRWTLIDPRSVQALPPHGVVTRGVTLDDDSPEGAARALSALLGATADEAATAIAATGLQR